MNIFSPGIKCEACGLPLSFKQLPTGKWCPCNSDGSDHWDSCKTIQRKRMGLINEDGSLNMERLEALKPALFSRSEVTHVWCGELPPWDELLWEYRNFTAEECMEGIVCQRR